MGDCRVITGSHSQDVGHESLCVEELNLFRFFFHSILVLLYDCLSRILLCLPRAFDSSEGDKEDTTKTDSQRDSDGRKGNRMREIRTGRKNHSTKSFNTCYNKFELSLWACFPLDTHLSCLMKTQDSRYNLVTCIFLLILPHGTNVTNVVSPHFSCCHFLCFSFSLATRIHICFRLMWKRCWRSPATLVTRIVRMEKKK